MSDDEEVAATADLIESRLHPDVVKALRHITWRDTELGVYEEEDVKQLGRHVI